MELLKRYNKKAWLPSLILLALITGCVQQPVFTPTPTRTPDIEQLLTRQATTQPTETASVEPTPIFIEDTPEPPTEEPVDEPTPTITETPSITETPTDTPPPPTPDDGLPPDHYWMIRPIPTGWADYGDRTYPYGTTAGGQYRPHTGMEFFNPASTPVVAVANATVVHAGNDWEVLYGPSLNFYGNLIVLQLNDNSYNGRPVYALYGHLSEIYVEVGQAVPVGDIIGAVGATGIAAGAAHLHFEVRLDNPQDYFSSTRNPDLWIKPYWGYGTLAGRIVDAAGNAFRETSLTITGGEYTRYAWTYAGDENISDEAWGENFVYGDMPEGWYTITARSSKRTYTVEVYIKAGRTSWLEFIFD